MTQPSRLILPSTLACPFPASLRLNYADLGDGAWLNMVLMAVPVERINALEPLDPLAPTGDVESAIEALVKGQTPAAEVPRLSGTPSHPALYSRLSLLRALRALEFTSLPVLAHKGGEAWLRQHAGASEADLRYWKLSAS